MSLLGRFIKKKPGFCAPRGLSPSTAGGGEMVWVGGDSRALRRALLHLQCKADRLLVSMCLGLKQRKLVSR